jgi:hypothetical protein
VKLLLAVLVVAVGCEGDSDGPEVDAGDGRPGDLGMSIADGAAADGTGGAPGLDAGSVDLPDAAGPGPDAFGAGPDVSQPAADLRPPDLLPRDVAPVDLGPPGPPPIDPAARRLMPARTVLLGMHRTGCSYGPASSQPGAAHWCAISRPGAILGSLELWVLNVTEALAQPPGTVKCDGSTPQCRRLTTNLFAYQPDAGPVYPTAHRFYGDTLIYYANTRSAPSELHRGPAFAWQPGWDAPRQIASDNGVQCSGLERASVAVCIENISPEGVTPVTWDIHAGALDVGLLKKVATINPVHPTTEASQWGSGFTLDGAHFMFSTPSAATGNRETLFVIKTADIGTATPTQVGEPGISRWALSASGARWFYLRDYNYNRVGEPSGTLYMRDFPAGATETKLQGTLVPGGTLRGVGDYQVLADAAGADAGLGLLVNLVGGRGDYRVLKNPAGSPDDPLNVVPVASDIATRPLPSPDLRFFYLAKAVDEQVGTTDGWVYKADGTQGCSLTTTLASSVFGAPFTGDSSLVFWTDNFDAATDSGEGWVASPQGCAGKRRFSAGIDFWFVDGARALLYSDDSTGQRVSLRYAPVQSGQLGPSVTLQRQIDRMYAIRAGYQGVLFTITSNNESVDGVYHVPLPPP